MKVHQKTNEDDQKRMKQSIETQLGRLRHMDTMLYDDKLSGDISRERYDQKHSEFMASIHEFETKLEAAAKTQNDELQKRLVLFELAQKAAEIYPKKTIEQKRLIITKLFENITNNGGTVSVTYTNFARVIAQNVQLTKEIIGGRI